MACACRNKGKGFKVQLAGGLMVPKTFATEAAALAYAGKNPGSKVVKPAS